MTGDPDNGSSAAAHNPKDKAERTGMALILRAFRHRNYRLFFGGQIVSLVGTFLTQVATMWLVYTLTKQAFYLGVVGFAGQIPMFLLGPFGGVWVDRWNRQKLLIVTQTLAMLQSAALAVLAFTHITVWEIIALSVAQGVINAFDLPGRQAFLVEMVTDREDLANAIALNSTMVHGARLVGPAMAGLLMHWVGAGWCFSIDALSYIGVIAALAAMRLPPPKPRTNHRSVLHELAEGLRYVWDFVPMRVLILMVALLNLTGMPAYSSLMPIFADYLGKYKNGDEMLGILMGASGAGALVGALWLASRRTVLGLGKVMAISAAIFGAALIAFAFSRTLWISLLIVPFIGFGTITTFASANTILQTLADDDKRGRVMSIFTTAFIGMIPFGSLLAGTVATHIGKGHDNPQLLGAARTIILAGICCIGAAVAFASIRKRIRPLVWKVYVKKGVISEVAAGINAAAELTTPPEVQA